MNRLFLIKNHQFDLNISEIEFERIFNEILTNEKTLIGKALKGKIENNKFKIKNRNKLFNFSISQSQHSSGFVEMIGNFNENESILNVNLQLRIKPFLLKYWSIGFVVLFFLTSAYNSASGILISFLIISFMYLVLKVIIYVEEPFFINSFIYAYNLNQRGSEIEDLKLTIETHDNITIIRTKKTSRIFYGIGFIIVPLWFLNAIYMYENLSLFLISIPLICFVILSFFQYYQRYKLNTLKTSKEILDFWLLLKMAKIPIPSFIFNSEKLKTDTIEITRKKYNILTGLLYACLTATLILLIIELKTN